MSTTEREALAVAEIGLANLVSYQSACKAPSIHEYGQARRALEAVRSALAAAPAQVAPQQPPFAKMIDLRTSDGWKLSGGLAPLLYTDSINGEQICRDDLWVAATSTLRQAAPISRPNQFTDTERMQFLHSYGPTNPDADGYEWGVFRVKWGTNGQISECLQTLSDSSDLDVAIAGMASDAGTQAAPAPQPVAHFVNDAAVGAPPHYAQVAMEYARDPDVFPLYATPLAAHAVEAQELALAELIAVKDLKDRAEALQFAGPCGTAGESWEIEFKKLRSEYIRRQPEAWDAARAALATRALNALRVAAQAAPAPQPEAVDQRRAIALSHATHSRSISSDLEQEWSDRRSRVFEAAAQPEAAEPVPSPVQPAMPHHWSVEVEADGYRLLRISSDSLSGTRSLEGADEQTIIGAAQHLLAFVGYGLPSSQFDPDADDATPPAAQPADDIELPGMWSNADFAGGETDMPAIPTGPRDCGAAQAAPAPQPRVWWKSGDEGEFMMSPHIDFPGMEAEMLTDGWRPTYDAPAPAPQPEAAQVKALRAAHTALEWYRDESLALSINGAQKRGEAMSASIHVLMLDAGNRAITALCKVGNAIDSVSASSTGEKL